MDSPPSRKPAPTSPAASGMPTAPPVDTGSIGPPSAASRLHLVEGAQPLPDYQLVRRLGQGGFGEAWQALGPGGFDVALKFVRLDARAGAIELRALDLVKKVHHGNVLGLFGAWQREGLLILAMELGEGTLLDRLSQVVAEGMPGIPRVELLEQMREAARGVDHLNDLGIQHRDIKPQNLLLVGGCVKVADFGLAKVMDQTFASHSGAMTMSYAAPECFNGQTSRFTDQYALAVSYCQLRGNRRPFEGQPLAVASGHMLHPPDLTMLPASEWRAVARALAKKPEERWPSCRAFVEALTLQPATVAPTPSPATRSAPGMPLTQTRSAPVAEPGTARWRVAGKRPAAARRQQPSLDGRPWLWMVAGGAILVLGVLLTLGLVFWKASSPRGASAAQVPSLPGPAPARGVSDPASGNSGAAGTPVPDSHRGPATRPPEALPDDPLPNDRKPWSNSLGMRFVWIPPGSFQMGSPPKEGYTDDDETQHRVKLTRGFWIGAHLVTQYHWEQVMGPQANRSEFLGKDDNEKKKLPAENVSWDDSEEFCQRLGKKDGRTYRLPTEAEWEYACRAGKETPFWWGRSITTDQANYNGDATYGPEGKKGIYRARTTPVEQFPPNPWGLYDMHGNLWQWCQDWYAPYGDEEQTDPVNNKTGNARVLRGGSWKVYPLMCRAACRSRSIASGRYHFIGVRVVMCGE